MNPTVHKVTEDTQLLKSRLTRELDQSVEDEIDQLEVFDMIRHIDDPEHPSTLEELQVVYL